MPQQKFNRLDLRMLEALNRAKQSVLVAAGVAAPVGPVVVSVIAGLGLTSVARAQSPTQADSQSAASVQRSATSTVGGFEVASIKPCATGDGGRRGQKRGGDSPGRLSENCVTVSNLIRQAYVEFADGRQNVLSSVSIEGGPVWIDSETYSIEAKADSALNQTTMRGQMLQVLLNERFKLKIHTESVQVPVYALSVAKGGPKFPPTREGSCVHWTQVLHRPIPSSADSPSAENRDFT